MNSRPFDARDFEAVAALLEDDERSFGRPMEIGVNEIREWTGLCDLTRDSWLYEDDDGPVAVGWTTMHDELGDGVGVVHPRAKGRGLGAQLVARSEEAARRHGATRMHQFAIGADRAAEALLTSRGYRAVRRFYQMAIELTVPPEVPAGVAIDNLRPGEERAFHAALEEAFQDHWEHRGQPFEVWWERRGNTPAFDPLLWLVVRDGDEIAAVSRSEVNRNGGGYVGHLAVRRPWRGRGYAKALLLRTFREFWDRGIRRVTLGVDAESPTGATHLYERVGMHVESDNVIFEKAFA